MHSKLIILMFLEIDALDPVGLRIVLLKANHNTLPHPTPNSIPKDTNAPSPFPDDLLPISRSWVGWSKRVFPVQDAGMCISFFFPFYLNFQRTCSSPQRDKRRTAEQTLLSSLGDSTSLPQPAVAATGPHQAQDAQGSAPLGKPFVVALVKGHTREGSFFMAPFH